MINWYEDIAELIAAFNTEWFPQILQGALQNLFQYDYFLLVLYEKNRSLRIVRSDFRDVTINQALRYLEEENYIAEAMYRLFGANKLTPGLYSMGDLCSQAKKLPAIDIDGLPHILQSEGEEMGYRTVGWPKSLQETCIVIPIDDHHCAAISLYNTGLSGTKQVSTQSLEIAFPTIAALVRAYFSSPFGKKWQYGQRRLKADPTLKDHSAVRQFFSSRYTVDLTQREAEIFAYLLDGNTVSAIANELCISIHTAKTHRRNVYSKIGHGNQVELRNQFNN
ncbi:MAG: helix-turn-helix transcriptional regulator [Robiginitomaculum sp.]|nr:helix-turn-helix transcriptional regulator [Robiginitomaculum sp.]